MISAPGVTQLDRHSERPAADTTHHFDSRGSPQGTPNSFYIYALIVTSIAQLWELHSYNLGTEISLKPTHAVELAECWMSFIPRISLASALVPGRL
jgi:hypothetical protein